MFESGKEVEVNELWLAVNSNDDLELASLQETVYFMSKCVNTLNRLQDNGQNRSGSDSWEEASEIGLDKVVEGGIAGCLTARS